jgi:hypothetical protein
MFDPGFLAAGSSTNKVRVFVSYDPEHDADLYERLAGQAAKNVAGFEISSRSRTRLAEDMWDDVLRGAIREVDQVVVLCGEHTDGSGRMGAELRIAQEEGRPYLLLWGRREIMCTKPATARPADVMYSWTLEILRYQLQIVLHAARSNELMARLSRPKMSLKR